MLGREVGQAADDVGKGTQCFLVAVAVLQNRPPSSLVAHVGDVHAHLWEVPSQSDSPLHRNVAAPRSTPGRRLRSPVARSAPRQRHPHLGEARVTDPTGDRGEFSGVVIEQSSVKVEENQRAVHSMLKSVGLGRTRSRDLLALDLGEEGRELGTELGGEARCHRVDALHLARCPIIRRWRPGRCVRSRPIQRATHLSQDGLLQRPPIVHACVERDPASSTFALSPSA